ncbi:aminotransferase class III-fold pyridoxal phosphate-dependent enzyme [uncultured Sphingomonas sp.]|uniref:aminotransferase class III-fold pyridoxal phosphate-dependent enzyme n=1 Tax=uncultured Sphingomonas sp. TaxID=158754 RepID=UPI002636D649|nr:aminotransferase class III-fold pyridoxal phosphate-dependent enzyme [uncultured Sphingomonas sp.]
MTILLFTGLAGAAGLGLAATKGRTRLALSRAKHRSLTGHVRMGKRVAGLIPFYDYGEDRFFRADDAPDAVAAQRRAGFAGLAALYAERYARTRALTAETRAGLSDLQFTGTYRVPFQFSRIVREHLGTGAFLERSDGPVVTDLDGNRFHDLTGSYGVNLFGYDVYKQTIAEGIASTAALGPVLGAYHPVVADNVRRLKAISKLDEVSFHMSGTEAVMQAVRLARYHTRRKRVVRFAGAYHGWWGDVQPGIGNPIAADHTLTLAEMSEATLRVLSHRRDIACVLVNPLQALHPNKGAPSDGTLVDSSRAAGFDREAYTDWLRKLAAVCRASGIVLIFDEVFVGFRLGVGGAAAYFGVAPDMITYGKTLGGGLPVGVLCGRAALMKLARRPPGRHLLRARHLQCASRGDGRDGRLSAAARDARGRGALRRPRCPLGRARGHIQHTDGGRRPAGARRASLDDLDGHLCAAVALQLDAAILSPRRGAGAQLGRHRAADLQPRL